MPVIMLQSRNKANFRHDADPEIGVPGGRLYKQSQFPPKSLKDKELCFR